MVLQRRWADGLAALGEPRLQLGRVERVERDLGAVVAQQRLLLALVPLERAGGPLPLLRLAHHQLDGRADRQPGTGLSNPTTGLHRVVVRGLRGRARRSSPAHASLVHPPRAEAVAMTFDVRERTTATASHEGHDAPTVSPRRPQETEESRSGAGWSEHANRF